MTRSCCPRCHLRFSRQTAAHLSACPFCATALELLPASGTLGMRLVALDALTEDQALAVALPVPDPHE